MYIDYFGFHEKPFSLTPDPRFLYANPAYEEAYANLLYGIRERKGFIMLTGEVGTGKTTLLQRLMENLEDTAHFVFFYNTTLTFEELLDFACEELGLTVQTNGRLQKIQVLNHFLIAQLQQGRTVALLIDEAQNLGEDALENLRLLSNLETTREKLLQIVLVGQPELEFKLAQPALRQLKQRIATCCRLDRLKDREVGPFIRCRLRVAGYDRQDLFTQAAIQRIVVYAKGIPRLINLICDNALLLAYGMSRKTVSAEMIEEVAGDLRLKEDVRIVRLKSPLKEKRVTAPHDTGPPSMVQTSGSLPPTQTTATAGNGEAETAGQVTRSHTGQKSLVWAGLLALLIGSGIAIFYSPHAREHLANVAVKAKELLGTAEAQLTSFTYDLNAWFAGPLHAETDSAKNRSFIPPAEESQAPVQKEEAILPLGIAEHVPPITQEEEAILPLGIVEHVPPSAQEKDLSLDESSTLSAAGKETKETSTEPPSEQHNDLVVHEQEAPWKNRFVVIQPGATISGIVFEQYGTYNILALDLIKEFNPHIVDLDQVVAGEMLRLPPLTRDTLLHKQAENLYRLIVATFRSMTGAERFAQNVRRRGYTVEITRREISRSLLLHRVEIVGLRNIEEVSQAWDIVNPGNVLFGVPASTESSAVTDSAVVQNGAA